MVGMKFILMLLFLGCYCLLACAAYPELFKEMRDKGSYVSHSVQYPHPFKDTGVGMIVTKDIEPNKIVFKIPREAGVSRLRFYGTEMDAVVQQLDDDSYFALVLTILYEQMLGEKSHAYQFLSRLDKELVPLPQFWTLNELNELQNEYFKKASLEQEHTTKMQYLRTRQVLLEMNQTALLQTVNYDSYRWACAIVQSRAFQGFENTMSLIPIVDLMNHHHTNHLHCSQEDGAFVFYTPAELSYKAGEQIYYSYGNLEANLHTLRDYGYVAFPNELNSELIHIDQVTQHLVVDKQQRIGRNELALLYNVHWYELIEFFRLISARTVDEFYYLDFTSVSRDWQAVLQCVSSLRTLLNSKPTSIAEDYYLLATSAKDNVRLRLAIQYRIDAKVVWYRNKQRCEYLKEEMIPCLPAKHNAFRKRVLYSKLWRN